MNTKNLFRELAIELASKQPELVDYLLEEAPALSMMPFYPTSDGMNHMYEELEEVTGNGLVDADAELPSVGARTALKQTYLSILGGSLETGEDRARQMGGPGSIFESRLPHVLKKTGSDTETSIIYNTLRASAIETRNAGELSDAADHAIDVGGTGGTGYSIVVAKYEPGQLSGLYNPDGFGRGMLFDMEAINGGELYYTKESGQKVLGYGMRLKSYFGVLNANPRNTAALVNLDLALTSGEFNNIPTATQMDDVIDAVRGATGGNTVMYAHPKVISALRTAYKLDKLQMGSAETSMNTQLEAWNGIPIIGTYNMLRGSEADVTF